jgi:hypothetical protein
MHVKAGAAALLVFTLLACAKDQAGSGSAAVPVVTVDPRRSIS